MSYYQQQPTYPYPYPAGYPPQPQLQPVVQAGAYPQGYPPAPAYGQPQQGIPNWASQYGGQQNPMYANFFAAGDFTRTGYLDQAGLRAALAAAGEPPFDDETLEMMIMMFDTDNNRRIDFNEFTVLMGYVKSMEHTYASAAATTGGVGSRDASMLMANTHGDFMNNIGGNDVMERGILPTINPSQQGFYSIGNFIKIAIVIGLLRTLYEHNKLPFFNNQNQGQGQNMGGFAQQLQAQFGQQRPQQQYNQQYGAPGQPPQKSGGILGHIMSFLGRNN